jgi:hypothetical protein|tara:strand:+ start:147 stop:641 length:495 start_codon:yes stop_codon:yes gene_type:complete
MAFFTITLVVLALAGINEAAADDSMKIRQLDQGWIGLAKQTDPFDSSKSEVFQITKSGFTFRCGELNMEVNSYGFESLSFGADLKYMVDDQSPVEKRGQFSTYLGGSDMVTDSRYFSFNLNRTDVEAIKAGNAMKVAGKYSNTGWQTKSLSLIGFTSAYNLMCN